MRPSARPRQRIAIVGTGIAGNVVAHRLHREHDLTVFEADAHVGGHTHTHDIEHDGERHRIDTGFIVFNDRTYPQFRALLDELGVAVKPTTMSLSVRNDASGVEYNGSSLAGLFAQRRNLLRPAFHRMLRDILRFNREAPALLDAPDERRLGPWLHEQRYRREFIEDYLVPMGAAIWSTDPERMLDFPARFFVRFLHHHGLLSIDDRPQWYVVEGGSATYVERLVAPWRDRIRLSSPVERVQRRPGRVMVQAAGGRPEPFDHVVLACHSDQALRLLADPSPAEREILGAIRYQANEAVLHTDTRLLPRSRRAWAAWNCQVQAGPGQRVAVTYDMNRLQGLRSRHTWCVTLNRSAEIDPGRMLRRMAYHHPLYTPAGVAAQARHAEISGVRRTHYCGAWWGHGFHEDGVASAAAALARLHEAIDAQRDLPRVA